MFRLYKAAIVMPYVSQMYVKRKWYRSCSPAWHLLTPWSRVFLEKLTGFAASQEIPPHLKIINAKGA